jgi:hypothetical protein
MCVRTLDERDVSEIWRNECSVAAFPSATTLAWSIPMDAMTLNQPSLGALFSRRFHRGRGQFDCCRPWTWGWLFSCLTMERRRHFGNDRQLRSWTVPCCRRHDWLDCGRLYHRQAPPWRFFRDTAHGFVAWAFATVLTATALAGAGTPMLATASAGAIRAAGAGAARRRMVGTPDLVTRHRVDCFKFDNSAQRASHRSLSFIARRKCQASYQCAATERERCVIPLLSDV